MDLALQNAIFLALVGDAALDAILARNAYESPTVSAVYDQPPQADAPEDDSAFPYVEMGDISASEFDTDDVHGKEFTVTLHVWDRYHGRRRCKQVMDAMHDLLHDQQLVIQGVHFVYCYWQSSLFVPDEDRLTQHGVTVFRVAAQKS